MSYTLIAAAADASAGAVARGITFMQAWEWGGWIMWLLAGLSTVALALAIYIAVSQRVSAVAAAAFAGDVCDAVRKGDRETALRMAERSQCAFAEIAEAALSVSGGEDGPARARSAMESCGSRIAERMNMTVEYLLDIASIAPLTGLLGTVLGMFRAFGSVASDIAAAKPVSLAQGVTQALVTTVFGLALTIPVLAAYAFLRRRAARRAELLETAAEDLADAIEDAARATRAAAPGAAQNPHPKSSVDAAELGRLLGAAR